LPDYLATTTGWCLAILLWFTSRAAADQPNTPLFILHTCDGAMSPMPLQEIRDDWSIVVGQQQPKEISGRVVVSLRRSGLPLPGHVSGPRLVFTNGDELGGHVAKLGADRLRFSPTLDESDNVGPELVVPLSVVSQIWLAFPNESLAVTDALRRLRSVRRRQDEVILKNGDVIDGTLTSMDNTAVHVSRANGEDLSLDRERVAGVLCNPELGQRTRPRGPYGHLVLLNGGRLAIRSGRGNGRAIEGKTVFGATIQVRIDELAAIDLYQGCAVYLSELKPSHYEFTPYLGKSWPFKNDLSVAGNPIRIARSNYDRGIGMHSQSRLTYELGGKFRWFEAWAGIDDQTGKLGSVLIDILVDGKSQRLVEAGELTSENSPRVVRINVSGAKALTLSVRFGRNGDVQDHVDWADARLIK
jgi:hypothetical protein